MGDISCAEVSVKAQEDHTPKTHHQKFVEYEYLFRQSFI
jgi:hypothetical protein